MSRPGAGLVAVAAALAAVAATAQPAASQPTGAPVLTVHPAEVTSVQAPEAVITRELAIGNAGDDELEWRVFEGEPQPRPVGPATPVPPAAPADPDAAAASLDSYLGHGGRSGWTVTPQASSVPETAVRITHSDSAAVTAGNGIACTTNGITTTAASFLRHFTLPDFAIVSGFEVTSVSFGVEHLSPAGRELAVNLYTLVNPEGPFDYHNFDRIGTAGVPARSQRMAMVEVPVSGTVPAGATLVVEVEAPDLSRGGFFAGAGPAGQSAPSYLQAEACGIASPTPLPDLQLLMSVTGVPEVAACPAPSGVPWLAVDPLAGAVAPGETQVVEVTFDAAGRTDCDELAAELCLVANDPQRPSVFVPLSMRVEDICDRTILGVHPGPLTVTSGVTCLAAGARVAGEVNVLDGAGLVATAATVQGPVATFGATIVTLSSTQVTGPVAVRGTTGSLSLSGSLVVGSVLLANNTTGEVPIVVSGNTIVGGLFCTGNRPPPVDQGLPNTATSGKLDQCAGL